MTEQRLTIACPVAMIADANQFARCTGYGPDDAKTFGAASWQDADGNLYSVSSGLVADRYESDATSPLVEPDWGCDLDAANRAQAALTVCGAANASHIVAVFGGVGTALSELGLSRVPIDPFV